MTNPSKQPGSKKSPAVWNISILASLNPFPWNKLGGDSLQPSNDHLIVTQLSYHPLSNSDVIPNTAAPFADGVRDPLFALFRPKFSLCLSVHRFGPRTGIPARAISLNGGRCRDSVANPSSLSHPPHISQSFLTVFQFRVVPLCPSTFSSAYSFAFANPSGQCR
jgi:hypothetical protein